MVRILEMFGEPITYGGQESVVYNMLSTFDLQNDFNVDLFTPYFADNKHLINHIGANGGNIYSLNIEFKTNDNRLLLSKYINSFFHMHNDYSVVHIHTGSLTTMYVFAKAAKLHGVKKVIVHSHIASNKNSLLYRLFKMFLNTLLQKYVDVYLGCSNEAITSKFTKKIVNKSKVIYNGIEINKFKFESEYRDFIRNEYNLKDKFVIGSLGRLDKQKNNLFMVDIIGKLSKYDDIMLMIVGTGPIENVIKNKCNDLGLSDKVIFTGNQIDSYKFYCAFDCFILPSLFEGLPVVSIEAQVNGLPVLLSDSITREACISSGTSYLDINNINVWVDNIEKLYKTKQFTRNNYNIDFKKFDRNNSFKIVEEIYKNS